MPRITRRFEFDAGHRVLGHENKCARLHGHRYVAQVTVLANDLDDLGRVVDFGVVKAIVGAFIDTYWDHNLLLNEADPLLKAIRIADGKSNTGKVPELSAKKKGISEGPIGSLVLAGWEPWIMSDGKNPTAETIADELLQIAQAAFDAEGLKHLRVTKVRIYETPNCWADAFPK